ncbi:acyl-CoA dehydrogenase family protein [Teredinibacter sp. KSP-S5-2]|uniref:acyl-CoA dehydrogenase family protein n=1 Tax=Teredinibacter sp. KSP-S5-2 TaxID=3034506 RepID=UPI0029344C64|nr:acyl-CoA dehydrogenase family protein [Teredinibacter sp. KSP-S5-2]WNO10696.1 acyl-CoA dehydrogenase family protein [Teredinibacter sp. KSP-S5-2]
MISEYSHLRGNSFNQTDWVKSHATALAETLSNSPYNGELSLRNYIGECFSHQLYPEDIQDWQYFNALTSEYLAAQLSVAEAEVIGYQQGFLLPLLFALDKQPPVDRMIELVKTGERIFSGIPYQTEHCLNQLTVKQHENKYVLNGQVSRIIQNQETDFHCLLATNEESNNLCLLIVEKSALDVAITAQKPFSKNEDCLLARAHCNEFAIENVEGCYSLSKQTVLQIMANNNFATALRANLRTRLCLDFIVAFLRERTTHTGNLLSIDVIQQRLAACEAQWSMHYAHCYFALTSSKPEALERSEACRTLAFSLLEQVARESQHLGGIIHYRTDSPLADLFLESRRNLLLR